MPSLLIKLRKSIVQDKKRQLSGLVIVILIKKKRTMENWKKVKKPISPRLMKLIIYSEFQNLSEHCKLFNNSIKWLLINKQKFTLTYKVMFTIASNSSKCYKMINNSHRFFPTKAATTQPISLCPLKQDGSEVLQVPINEAIISIVSIKNGEIWISSRLMSHFSRKWSVLLM